MIVNFARRKITLSKLISGGIHKRIYAVMFFVFIITVMNHKSPIFARKTF